MTIVLGFTYGPDGFEAILYLDSHMMIGRFLLFANGIRPEPYHREHSWANAKQAITYFNQLEVDKTCKSDFDYWYVAAKELEL